MNDEKFYYVINLYDSSDRVIDNMATLNGQNQFKW